MSGEHPLIHLEGLSKVFYTEEVETHALSNINLSVDARVVEHQPVGRDGRVRIDCGAVRLWEDDAAVDSRTSG